MKSLYKSIVCMLAAVLILFPFQIYSDEATSSPTFSKEEIEQMVAPIALYSDTLVSQILMASTYPLEIVSAARWRKANASLKDKALDDALKQQTWDPSVKSLTVVPQALDMLNQNIDMTEKLGDAFLAQPKDVLDAVQRLRAKAQSQGNLKSNKEQTVNSNQENGSTVITIVPANPDIIYVPIYNPTLIYGAWPYSSYVPYYYYPTGFQLGDALISFGIGLAVGNLFWGGVNWHDGYLNVNVDRYNHLYGTHLADANWHHDVDHRKGVPYRDRATQEKYGKNQIKANESRDALRSEMHQQNAIKNEASKKGNKLNQQNRGKSQTHQRNQGNRIKQRNPERGQHGSTRRAPAREGHMGGGHMGGGHFGGGHMGGGHGGGGHGGGHGRR